MILVFLCQSNFLLRVTQKKSLYKAFILWSVTMSSSARWFIRFLALLITLSNYFINNSNWVTIFFFHSNYEPIQSFFPEHLTICRDSRSQCIHCHPIPAWQFSRVFWHILIKLLLNLWCTSSQPWVNSPAPLICSCIYPRCQLDILFSILPNSRVTQSGKQHIKMEIAPRKMQP